ncbi:MAG: hypothetical protein LBC70_05280 [Chitinispirillales bacterium]|jgi:hypothetical protein|nr:hypothetical protein [Chitinispirillales bacterium]
MESVTLVLNAENLRTLFIIIAIGVSSTWFRLYIGKKFDEMEGKFNSKFDAIDAKFVAFKENDFAHLNRTIKALTFTLEKNKFLDPEDKKFVDSHLDEK